MRYAGLVEYDGAGFAGWAAQPGRRTVENTLAGALATVLRQPVRLTVAGRTDAGVHASGQVVSFEAETDLMPSSIFYGASAILPEDLALKQCVAARNGFDARKDARSRSYEYWVLNDPIRSPLLRRRALHVAGALDPGLLKEAASLAKGTHDFRAFTPTKSHHIRFVRKVKHSSWETRAGLLVYTVTAESFLYGMVRTLVGTMLEVARSRRDLTDFEHLLSGGERKSAGPTVPAWGLTLIDVGYEDLDFGEAPQITPKRRSPK